METIEMPQSIDAEQAVLCSMMLEEEAALKVAEQLTADDFYRESHKVIYNAILGLMDKGQKPDTITLEAELQQLKKLDDVGGLQYLIFLTKYYPTAAQVMQHVKIVKEASLKRQLLRLGRTLIANVGSEDDSNAQLEAAQQGLSEIANQEQSNEPENFHDALESYINYISSLKLDENGLTGMATHYEEFDKLTNGLNKSDLIILAARPSMGKTAMALNLVENILLYSTKKYQVAFFSLEMSRRQLISRILAILTGIDNHRMDSNQLKQVEWDEIWAASALLSEKGLYIDDTPGLTLTKLRNRAKKIQRDKGLDLIVIDYLQLMESSKTHSNDRQQQIAEISRSLKCLARELNVPVIALSQLSRSVEGRQMKRPILSDIRDSGSIEQDADLVIFLYRDDYYFRDSKEPGITEMIIAKHRNGPLGVIKFLFEKQYTKFVQLL